MCALCWLPLELNVDPETVRIPSESRAWSLHSGKNFLAKWYFNKNKNKQNYFHAYSSCHLKRNTVHMGSCRGGLVEKDVATHATILASRIPWTGEPVWLLSVGSHRVGHDWSDLAAAAAAAAGGTGMAKRESLNILISCLGEQWKMGSTEARVPESADEQ